ncbi:MULTISPECIES: hypothetical protein [unclassified Nocardiopsis]|uniref:hypothetical protein n=1 Tax=Nocardiopsis TaxID=2013 RepID=UPI00387AFC49
MTTKTSPIAKAQTAADKATRNAQDAHQRAQDAAQALAAAQVEHDRIVTLVGAGKADADALADANHKLTHAREVAQATATYAEGQEKAARLARLGVAQAHIDHLANDRDQALSHMNAITEHIQGLINLNGQRNAQVAEILTLLRAEGIRIGKRRDEPAETDAGLMIRSLQPAVATTYIQHPNGELEVDRDIAGAIVANAIVRATNGNPHKLNSRISLVGRFDREKDPADLIREIYGD